MDYALENLGPERFQEFCHALLVKAYPKTQCFPVGQRDGGRDAISYYSKVASDKFVVYQVKYVRKPQAENDLHKWLIDVVEEEAPKVSKLVPKGASEYYLLTNIPGTAFPESGSIDSVQKILEQNFSIPAQCWWRDDINRRLDDAWDIKWSYPEILSAPDILRYIIENGLSEDNQRRSSAIHAFVRDQYERDTEVKFKQVELQNKLLDLFIDVPLHLAEIRNRRRQHSPHLAVFRSIAQESGADAMYGRKPAFGSASFLLHPATQMHYDRVVVEGAPGQGKSTIVQYVCQIHRTRLLNENVNDPRIPENHRSTAVRLPFKIDCRDFALWLARKNPFSADDTDSVPESWQKSLESFLAAQVQCFSGGVEFSVADLHAILRISSVLLVFDGLDEVADIALRRDVVEQITTGANRLQDIAVSIQTIVTSRPAAFANSPGPPESSFVYLHLASITRHLIEQYAEKWVKARKLGHSEAGDVRRILRGKLDEPHLKELARNPMQLAILLSLIQTRGGSLPDKRTALYDSYVELFFNRESEKSDVVRQYRDLLVDIHQYLAWLLHAESQTRQTRGSVGIERLRSLVRSYLTDEEHDPSLADTLFTGMVERVVALVSRVEGTYEFEVQPLREYFAARYLYNTAPYSPPGNEKRGTKPDRFDALSRDFFWLNVARFYAGCYSKGELPSLVECLDDLAKAEGYKFTSHPQTMSATLLSDWVFAQHPKSMKQVVSLLLDDIGMHFVSAEGSRFRRSDTLVLPKHSGKEELVDKCFQMLVGTPPPDCATVLVELINANARSSEAKAHWLTGLGTIASDRKTKWIACGKRLGVLAVLENDELDNLLSDGIDTAMRLDLIASGGKPAYVEANEHHFDSLLDYLLSTTLTPRGRRPGSVISTFVDSLAPYRYITAILNRDPVPLSALWNSRFRDGDNSEVEVSAIDAPPFQSASKCLEVIELAKKLSDETALSWATELRPWSELVELGRRLFNDRWAFAVLANAAAGINSKDETCDDATSLFDNAVPLCRRVRYARLRAGAHKWWEGQLDLAEDLQDSCLLLLVLLNWGGPTVLEKLSVPIGARLEQLGASEWGRLWHALRLSGGWLSDVRRPIALDKDVICAASSKRLIVALSNRVSEKNSHHLFQVGLRDYSGDDRLVLELCQSMAIASAIANPETWQEWLPIVSKSYSVGIVSDRYFGYQLARAARSAMIPEDIARSIVSNCRSYPTELVAAAEQCCRQRVAESIVPVGDLARKQAWFG